MCEIFTIKGNNKKVLFPKDSFEYARKANQDGAGYVIFNKLNDGKYEVAETVTFPEKFKEYEDEIEVRDWREAERDIQYEYWNDIYNSYGTWTKEGGFTETPADFDNYEYDYDMYHDDKGNEYRFRERIPKWGKQPQIGFKVKNQKKKKDTVVNDIFKRQNKLKKNQLMIVHFRLATSGLEASNTQPLIEGEYMVIHNGVFGFKALPKGMSDTRYFAHKLNESAKKLRVKTEKQERNVINKMFKFAEGYYSCFIYSFKTQNLYYKKNETASFATAHAGLLGATRSSRFPVFIQEKKDMVLEKL